VLLTAVFILQVIGNSNSACLIHSIYIHVYEKVICRFLSVMATFAPLFVSFAVVFIIIFPNVIIYVAHVLQKITINFETISECITIFRQIYFRASGDHYFVSR
jgi:hypothetical protein